MNKLVITLLCLFLPGLVLADNSSSLSFAPPASDYSVVFLGNLFGVVDGVLSGTGSQIMGSIFAVFNAAVLALGGIVIMYTLIVSTMNTAHEGQMLGQKWSSVWIPIRSTVGLALLMPKASGYCMMQIFVMWVVIQGVGAADKVWNAALSYLNRGGVIVQAQQSNPTSQLTNPNSGLGEIKAGIQAILPGEVCMLGLQNILTNIRSNLLSQQSQGTGSGPCKNAISGSPMSMFCTTVVPDFISSVNPVSFQSNTPLASDWTLPMPNFESGPYVILNGICGSIHWNNISTLNSKLSATAPTGSDGTYQAGQNASMKSGTNWSPNVNYTAPWDSGPSTSTNYNSLAGNNSSFNTFGIGAQNTITLSPSEQAATQISRAVAIQQVITNLSLVAQSMISNDPDFSSTSTAGITPATSVAIEQFGVPYTQNGTICSDPSQCTNWGPAQGTAAGGATLFNGTELINAMNAYNGIMMPVVNLSSILNSAGNANNARAFINTAESQGWVMAGAYFFNLIAIQGSSTSNANQTDTNTGLKTSSFNVANLTSPFGNNACVTGNSYANLCTWLSANSSPLNAIVKLITNVVPPSTSTSLVPTLIPSSTVNGYMNNAFLMQTPGQPGTAPLTFANTFNFSVQTAPYMLSMQSFDCGPIKFMGVTLICLGWIMGNLLYNLILVPVYNLFILMIGQIIQSIAMAFLMIPLTGMAAIFRQGLSAISTPGVNPVVALANMGNWYINFSGNLWIMFITMSAIPGLNIFILPIMLLAMPLILSWVSIMVSVGFTTAFFIPVLPYMIFLFGALSWLMSVVEAMVAAPIVALGVTHPEGHDAFGKGESAIMILLNIFLRPSMMIIGYIAGIAMTYVGVWVLNAGYDTAIAFIQSPQSSNFFQQTWNQLMSNGGVPSGTGNYSDWTAIFAYFFSILTYTSMYVVIVQKSFELISALPDKVLRWIGGSPEGGGQESARWGEEVKGQQKGAADAGGKSMDEIGGPKGAFAGHAAKGIKMGKEALGKAGGGDGDVSAEGGGLQTGGDATPEGGGDGGGKKKPPGGGGLGGASSTPGGK